MMRLEQLGGERVPTWKGVSEAVYKVWRIQLAVFVLLGEKREGRREGRKGWSSHLLSSKSANLAPNFSSLTYFPTSRPPSSVSSPTPSIPKSSFQLVRDLA